MAVNSPRKKVITQNHSRPRQNNIIDTFANWLNNRVEFDERLSGSVVRKVLWIMLLVVIYIFFQHNFEGLIRRLNKTEQGLKADRAAYISHKSKYMFASKQSEIEKKLAGQGFEMNAQAPIKIEVNP